MSKKMQELANKGQSLWLDFIDRPLLETGKLTELIEQGLRGMTSNPSIFDNAISKTSDYDKKIQELKSQGKDLFQIYDALTITDIQEACDQFSSVYEQTKQKDGYVSLEINPKLANDTQSSIDEGKRLFAEVNRPNVMIKVPATDAGFPVITELIASGININTTLIFSLKQYERTVHAYLTGLRKRLEAGESIENVHSVASVFISRVDSTVDKWLDKKMEADPDSKNHCAALKGQLGVANAARIYQHFEEVFGEDFNELREKSGNVQRVLWASTGTKNPDYSDVKYVEELIADDTVNTLPEKTLNAYIDHGSLETDFDNFKQQANERIEVLAKLGLSIDDVCKDLLDAGVVAFEDAFTHLFDSLEQKSQNLTVGSN